MEDQDISSFLAACAKQFCPWCGTPVGRNVSGRPRKFCSDKCRYAMTFGIMKNGIRPKRWKWR